MRSGIDQIQITPEQYIRTKRSSIARGINRRLVFDYQKYILQPFSLSCSDFLSFHDQIVHSASSLDL